MQVFDDLLERPWSWGTVTPGKAGPIVRTDLGELRDVRLDESPAQRRSRYAGFKENSRTSRTQADGMKAVVADVDELSGRRKPASAAPGTNGLIEDTQDRQTEEHESGDAHGFIVTERRRTVQRSDPDQYITYFLRISRTTPG